MSIPGLLTIFCQIILLTMKRISYFKVNLCYINGGGRRHDNGSNDGGGCHDDHSSPISGEVGL